MTTALLAVFFFIQQPVDSNDAVTWHVSSEFQMLAEAYVRVDAEPIQGFRVQLFNGSRREAEKRRADLLRMYDNVPVYLSYDAPEYLVHAGNFIDRIHAEAFALELKEHLSSAFVISSPIESPTWEMQQSALKINADTLDNTQSP